MTSEPILLHRLASMTASRDVERMKFSLLQTVKGFLSPRSLRLVRLNGSGQPSMETSYGEESCAVHYENLLLSKEIELADSCLSESEAACHSMKVDEGMSIVYPLTNLQGDREYLQIVVDAELTQVDSHLMAGLLQIYRNFVTLMLHSQTDQLTGLSNRKTFDECVSRIGQLIPNESEPMDNDRRAALPMNYWMVMVDIDHFKLVNDRFGHLYGDEVLILLAQQMKLAFRADDMIFRFGGEEFVLVIRCADQAACRSTLERFRSTVENYPMPQVGKVTISIGATRMERETFPAAMIDHADQALYHSKRNGRNQVTFFEDLLEQGLVTVKEIETAEIQFF